MNQESEQCLKESADIKPSPPAIHLSRASTISSPNDILLTDSSSHGNSTPVNIAIYSNLSDKNFYPERDAVQINNNTKLEQYDHVIKAHPQKEVFFSSIPEFTISQNSKRNSNEDIVLGCDYFDEDNTKKTDPSKHKSPLYPKRRHRGIITLAGYILNINVLLSAMILDSAWFYRVVDSDSDPTIRKNFPLHILLFVFLIISMISFIFRCLGFSVLITTFISVFFSVLNSFGGYLFAIIFYNTYYKKDKTLSVSFDFYGSIFAYTMSLCIVVLLVYDMVKTPNFRFRGSGMSRQQRKMQFTLMALYAWSILEAVILVLVEPVRFYEGVYISFVTMTTIGFGDMYPSNSLTRIITFFWFSVSIILATLYLISIRDVMVQFISMYYAKKIREFESKKKKFDKNAVRRHNMSLLHARPEKSLKVILIPCGSVLSALQLLDMETQL
ncbi:hypothetical protein BB561_000955 [Smittium simulii]|uniref:Potassium channel domain-containing protein n=1 Tax=Smittium simulii TaxID=133385 RepID=A0A2T9YWW1_9FUNG|nr:hypothetical protein BB561_000955 [Smittium simulii]